MAPTSTANCAAIAWMRVASQPDHEILNLPRRNARLPGAMHDDVDGGAQVPGFAALALGPFARGRGAKSVSSCVVNDT